MQILSKVIGKSLDIGQKIVRRKHINQLEQNLVLRKLLEKARYTQIGRRYDFEAIENSQNIIEAFSAQVPIVDYVQMQNLWWHKLQEGIENVTWPGKVNFFAMSSGTSDDSSKYIPVTEDLLRSTRKVATDQMFSLSDFGVSDTYYTKGVLMLGGSMSLEDRGEFMAGDMSGISAFTMPQWMNLYYKPGTKISRKTSWEERIELIVKSAHKWDVSTICGLPSWVQLVIEEILTYNSTSSIYDIWPNLELYIHGGISILPFKYYMQDIFGDEMKYMETYMASEGSFGFQRQPHKPLSLSAYAGVYFEFLPFPDCFEDGLVSENARAIDISQIQVGVPYALVISTVGGAWRYLIGDVIEFSDISALEFRIIGRTKHYLNTCGEHVSIDNLDQAIQETHKKWGVECGEYTVFAQHREGENKIYYDWYIGSDLDTEYASQIAKDLDECMKKVNDDYEIARKHMLDPIQVKLIPNDLFSNYLRVNSKFDAMKKFPRVLKDENIYKWLSYIASKK